MIHETIISNSFISPSLSSICENELNCSNSAYFSCHHCPKFLCLKHLIEHNTLNNIRADELSNEIENVTECLSKLDTYQSCQDARDKLDRWKDEILSHIERVYEQQLNEINQFETELKHRLNIFRENININLSNLQTQLNNFRADEQISRHQLSSIESNVQQIRQCMNSVTCEIYLDIKEISWHNLLNISNAFTYDRILTNITQIQPYRTLSLENINEFISNKTYGSILCLDMQRQLYYIDKHFKTHLLTVPQTTLMQYQTRIPNIHIVDIKWCSFAKIFLILFPQCLFSFNDKTGKFTHISLTRYKDYPFHCISCFDENSFYISYSTSNICVELWKYSLNNSNEITMNEYCFKFWDQLTNDKNEWISHMNTNSIGQLGLIIQRGSSIYRRFELRDKYLNFLKKIQLNNDYITAVIPFRTHYWLIKSLAEKFYIYSIETDTCILSTFDFPFGLQEYGKNSIVIGMQERKLVICDILF
ncbi:hypothetical protein I4U23_003158 [Adineta vaga]|nr:hypothetical protein I4U23_003158 [Adineta vaga]